MPGAERGRLSVTETAPRYAQPDQYAASTHDIRNRGYLVHLMIFVTRPAPTVRPPSRIANLRPSSIAIGWMSENVIVVLSPGITISVPSGSVTTPVTSVVRK